VDALSKLSLLMAQSIDSKTGRCSYLPPKEREDGMLDLRDQILVR
jgi:hypothetical protein